jgi:hypothetical protein
MRFIERLQSGFARPGIRRLGLQWVAPRNPAAKQNAKRQAAARRALLCFHKHAGAGKVAGELP